MGRKVKKIDLAEFEGPVFSGRDRGEAVREQTRLDEADRDNSLHVEVIVPDSTYSVTSSFFLGLFGPSIVRAGTPEKFYEKYEFHAASSIKKRLDAFVARALQSKALFG